MKNVTKLTHTRPGFRIPVPGLILRGWAVRYVSGVDDPEMAKKGDWLSEWWVLNEKIQFAFEGGQPHMAWPDENEAKKVRDFLRENAEIETELVKVG